MWRDPRAGRPSVRYAKFLMYTLVYDAYARRVMRHREWCGGARASGTLGGDGDGGRGDDGAVKRADFPVKTPPRGRRRAR